MGLCCAKLGELGHYASGHLIYFLQTSGLEPFGFFFHFLLLFSNSRYSVMSG